ncbi:6-O-methylguanine DNA methyltransferase [Candidatus Nomurabacteria bacterium RIFCSPHIGHO2_01_FULL_39_220]|uniref:6-O-methylguanine DNA methyltransferase n=1 Tax=Candidatus Nomurabacteria bacterium RIFCSPLOWO2_02_FULL_40_67 TaxID=1801787 RepID=A0A1F6Y2M3_9BACT|nr:MAG: O-6-methylguanine DNA methyltransferase [Parcubacteria group bacterium GW2011_GWA2_40_37]KKS10948.1 MAG: O-6-methylguanine DNA methyltransferase [Parcubacteria group bacterium GW2011_GWB1_41_5]OGI61573.1 MAG: 6-O-methylguanine DNA methyltransferase [Candidatus Nomurabacteria bacterium RBG_16_40_11]OGI71025.1 MAG: 6-O-methylguanine DNA methyltransferase [Candidatus Nomurabacteria bacterium RIFCSPHIGHO2_01_FULL_39_220]OGI72478.1 MAG: 6-O-methylguanine DNA methyltransferase [Candidatus Nom
MSSLKEKFRQRVLNVVKNIQKGKTMTYKEVAKRSSNALAARAVGNIMAKNFDQKVPCHRVIKSDGTLGNYNRGGLKAKIKLLRKEGAIK